MSDDPSHKPRPRISRADAFLAAHPQAPISENAAQEYCTTLFGYRYRGAKLYSPSQPDQRKELQSHLSHFRPINDFFHGVPRDLFDPTYTTLWLSLTPKNTRFPSHRDSAGTVSSKQCYDALVDLYKEWNVTRHQVYINAYEPKQDDASDRGTIQLSITCPVERRNQLIALRQSIEEFSPDKTKGESRG